MRITPPPIQNKLAENGTGLPTLPWVLFFNALFNGDTGTLFTPVPTNLTVAGTPIYTGAYYKSGQFIDFEIVVNPNGGNTTATAGSTYFQLPFDVLTDNGAFVVSGLLAAAGVVDSATNRIYTPSWSAVTVSLTITGRCRGR